jgi:motility quorum-sensing regulator/GCU-specific mRNA interferase toxin
VPHFTVDKRRPTYDLQSFKAAMSTVEKLAATPAAFRDARSLGIGAARMVAIIQTMQRVHFYKSTTSLRSHREWQDVYHVPHEGMTLYIKFVADMVTDFRVLSFKEK